MKQCEGLGKRSDTDFMRCNGDMILNVRVIPFFRLYNGQNAVRQMGRARLWTDSSASNAVF